MISVGENKAVICKGDFHPAELYKGDKKIAGYTTTEFSGDSSVVLENCYNDNVQNVTARGKNYFDLNKVPFNNPNTQPYKNGLIAQKNTWGNRGDKIPISLPVGKTIYITMDVVDSKIDGTTKYVTMGLFNSSDTDKPLAYARVTSTIEHKTYAVTLSEEVSYIQFYFQSNNDRNAVGDYVTMDNIMLRCEGDDTYEPYIEPRSITVRGKNLLKVTSGWGQTLYNNGFTFTRPSDLNSGAKMPINIKKGTNFTVSFDLIDFSADGDGRVRFRFQDSDGNSVQSSFSLFTASKCNRTITALEDLVSVQFYFLVTEPAGSYWTIDNVMIRTEGDDTYEPYIEPQTITFENGEPMADIPTFRGTTVLELESDITATISGKYKKQEG